MTDRLAEEISKARQELLNAVSHELNTPLTPVLIHLRRLQERSHELDLDLQQSFLVIDRNIERLIQRVHDMIKVTQLDSHRFPVNMRGIPFQPLVDQVVQDYRASARAAGLELRNEGGTPVNVHADPDRLAEVLSNLLDNAIKFTPRGGTITVSTDDDTIFAFARVTDTGVGFRKEDEKKLFEPFTHLETELPHAFHGAGLGLFISRNIMELHGGKLVGTSPGRGRGAKFALQLHIAKGTAFLPGSSKDFSKREVEFNMRVRDMV